MTLGSVVARQQQRTLASELGQRMRTVAAKAEKTAAVSTTRAADDSLTLAAKKAFMVSEGNLATPLIDGKQVLTEALGIINGAQESIRFQTYLFGGQSAQQVAEALVAKHKAGVKVEVVMSPLRKMVGAEDGMKALTYLEKSGVDIRYYPTELLAPEVPKWRRGMSINHAKMVVADDRVAMVGGINFSDGGLGAHDFMMKLEGPSVKHVASMSAEDFALSGGRTRLSPSPSREMGKARVRIAESSPTVENIKELMLGEFQQARKSISVSAFLLDDPKLLQSLIEAKRRGVDVRVLLDQSAVKEILNHVPGGERLKKLPLGSIPNLGAIKTLKEAGIPVRLFEPHDGLTCLHGKIAIIDGKTTVMGSANFTQQAMTRNRELALTVDDGKLAEAYQGVFEKDWAQHSSEVKALAPWQSRTASWLDKIKDIVYKEPKTASKATGAVTSNPAAKVTPAPVRKATKVTAANFDDAFLQLQKFGDLLEAPTRR